MKLQDIEDTFGIYGFIFSLSNRIQTIGDKEFEDMTIKQHFFMIGLMMFSKPPTLKEMGNLIGCSYQNIKRMAEQLQKNGYLNIVQDSEDRRKLLLVPTDKILLQAKRDRQKTEHFMSLLYQDIAKEDLAITLRTLMKMDQNLGGVLE